MTHQLLHYCIQLIFFCIPFSTTKKTCFHYSKDSFYTYYGANLTFLLLGAEIQALVFMCSSTWVCGCGVCLCAGSVLSSSSTNSICVLLCLRGVGCVLVSSRVLWQMCNWCCGLIIFLCVPLKRWNTLFTEKGACWAAAHLSLFHTMPTVVPISDNYFLLCVRHSRTWEHQFL